MKTARLILAIFFSGIVWLFVDQYFFCPRFTFNAPKPFTGSSLYNPYNSLDSRKWVKSNFHAHTNAWKGISNGHGTAQDIFNAYDSLGYGIHCISDYHKINKTLKGKPGFISAYEHGYGFNKNHHNVLGEERVVWKDYIYPQTLNNKQHILNLLFNDAKNVIIINHPSMRDGFAPSDFKYLTNYHCIEVLNPSVVSLAHWDSALSAGKPAFIVGNDDIHDVFTEDRLGSMCTWVNVPVLNKENVLKALRAGNSYGMIVGDKKDSLPALEKIEITNDTISINMNKPAASIRFIGQNGQLLKSYDEVSSAQFFFKPTDTYVRAEMIYKSGTIIYLNPVFRFDKTVNFQLHIEKNKKSTLVFRLVGIIILLIWLWAILLFVRFKKPRRLY